MIKLIKKSIKSLINKFGFDLIKIRYSPKVKNIPVDFEPPVIDIIHKVKPFTMTSPERISSLYHAVRYILKENIQGDIVECGVWKGGSMMAAMMVLVEKNTLDRNFFLYDTFEGMSAPTAADRSYTGQTAAELMESSSQSDQGSIWCYSSLEEVKENIKGTGYPLERVTFVKGKVEDTLPGILPGTIALLRLDTDFYESTLQELRYLFPLLIHGGVLIIDDYGHWEGARKAVDEYMAGNHVQILLNRIDYSGRIAIKTDMQGVN